MAFSTTERSLQIKADALEERLIDFAVAIVPLADQLGASFVSRNIAAQLVRSASSPAANYAEARSAESRADFIHKLGVAIKELNETSVWLRITTRARLLPPALLAEVTVECIELQRVLGASIRTACLRAANKK
jgi:four helix bundle protein